MPSTSAENKFNCERIKSEMPMETFACMFLAQHGFTQEGGYIKPPKGRIPDEDEWEMIEYLICEWDWGYQGKV